MIESQDYPMNLSDYSKTGRRSSAVEQLIRNQQVGGSIPLAGSSQGILGDIKV